MNKAVFAVMAIALFLVSACAPTENRGPGPEEGRLCTQEVKECPDGSSVGRNPANNCEFNACPEPAVEENRTGGSAGEPAKDNKTQEKPSELPKGPQGACKAEDRDRACTKEYVPVCGWYLPSKVQCVRYPCAATYGNACAACADSNVEKWTIGLCPTDPSMELRTYCTPEQKKATSCGSESKVVCGYTDEEAQSGTYSSPCNACRKGEVAYWEDGKCMIGQQPEEEEEEPAPPDKTLCKPEDRGKSCSEELEPVCGDNGESYYNACQACADDTVNSWVPEVCSGEFE